MKNKYFVVARSLLIAIAIAFAGGYLNELGVKLLPQYENYVDNVVAIIIVIPLIYFVFVPIFAALSQDQKKAPPD
ncbi:MAG: hypothetical protein H0W24_06365 [Lysobacter sp.]|nr:hypothetical protein [Lysobacter sp.]